MNCRSTHLAATTTLLAWFGAASGCGASHKVATPPPGVEIAAETGAEDGANRPLDGKVLVSDAEVKAAAKRARQAARDQQLARNRRGRQSQQERQREEGREREAEKEKDLELDGIDPQKPESAPAKNPLKALPRDPNPPATVAAPSDVAAAPLDALRTHSGVAHKVIKPGNATEHPGDDDLVTVHYSGWTTDGKLFDSSVVRGVPARMALSQVIQGWRDGVRLMVVGETRRLWIPEHLAYQGRAGAPRGMLVFDVELLAIEQP